MLQNAIQIVIIKSNNNSIETSEKWALRKQKRTDENTNLVNK